MSDLGLSMPSHESICVTPQKRPSPEPELDSGTTPSTVLSSVPSTRHSSPLRGFGETVAIRDDLADMPASTLAQKSVKRRKLTHEEKEQKRIEKENKDRERAEQKAQKEREKAHRDEERAQKAKLKEEDRQRREDEKKAKDEIKEGERRRREEAELKKQKAQPRLTSFFIKSSPTPTTQATVKEASVDPSSPSPTQHTKTDYEETFWPFAVKPYVTLAPLHYFFTNTLASEYDVSLSSQDFQVSKKIFAGPRKCRRGLKPPSTVKQIIQKMQESAEDSDMSKTASTLKESLSLVPVKVLKFAEDYRPPYSGTKTRLPTEDYLSTIAKKPFDRSNPHLNYDNDSEAEWGEPEDDGEDIDTDGEEEMEEDEPDDMADFLDDEDAMGPYKPLSSQEPIFTGLCWEGEQGKLLRDDTFPLQQEVHDCRMEPIEAGIGPIDPFSDHYWKKSAMEPPSLPVVSKGPVQTKLIPDGGATPQQQNIAPPTAISGPMMPSHEANEFKAFIVGKNDTKIGLLANLKQRFPRLTNTFIKEKLDEVAFRTKVPNTKIYVWQLKET